MAAAPDMEPNIAELYLPQFEQLGIALLPRGIGWYGEADRDDAAGYGWIAQIAEGCLVMEHEVVCRRDMSLVEYVPLPYACVSSVSTATARCMPESGIVAHRLALPAAPGEDGFYSFVNDACGETVSPLTKELSYWSRSIMFTPEYFKDLAQREGSEFGRLFESFATGWNGHAARAVSIALQQISPARALMPAARLRLTSAVEGMVAELAISNAETVRARAAQRTRESRLLASDAALLVERALDEGRSIGVDEVASRLYVSRSRLCAVFKQERGEGLGAHIRRRRCERAQELLAAGGLTAAAVASRLGYPSQTAFAHAFKQACGLSPTAWRADHR